MRQRAILQPNITISAPTTQNSIDQVKLGNNRSGVVYADILSFGGTFTILIESASDAGNATGSFAWVQVGTIAVAAAGVVKGAITELGDVIRWRVATLSTTNTFKLTAFLSDQG